MLTIATLCGNNYKSYLSNWVESIPTFAKVQVEEDDSKGIYEAKRNIIKDCDTEYIWMVDVDDILIKENFTSRLYSELTRTMPDIIQIGNSTGLWNYIFKTDFISKCYDEVEEAKKAENIDILDIVSCEDIVIPSTNAWSKVRISQSCQIPLVKHTVNDTSMTSSRKYNVDKLKSLYRNFYDLLLVGRHFENFDIMKRILLNNCYSQYWYIYRDFCSNKEECDKFMFTLYGDLLKKAAEL